MVFTIKLVFLKVKVSKPQLLPAPCFPLQRGQKSWEMLKGNREADGSQPGRGRDGDPEKSPSPPQQDLEGSPPARLPHVCRPPRFGKGGRNFISGTRNLAAHQTHQGHLRDTHAWVPTPQILIRLVRGGSLDWVVFKAPWVIVVQPRSRPSSNSWALQAAPQVGGPGVLLPMLEMSRVRPRVQMRQRWDSLFQALPLAIHVTVIVRAYHLLSPRSLHVLSFKPSKALKSVLGQPLCR